MPNPPGIWYNVREGKSEHGAKTYAHACMQRMVLLHVNAPASPGSRRVSGHLPERIAINDKGRHLEGNIWTSRLR